MCSSSEDENALGDGIPPIHTCIKSSADYELSLILKEIRFITDQVSVYLPKWENLLLKFIVSGLVF